MGKILSLGLEKECLWLYHLKDLLIFTLADLIYVIWFISSDPNLLRFLNSFYVPSCCIVIWYNYTHIHVEYILTQWIKTSDTVLRKIYLSLYLKGGETVTQDFTVRGSWRPNRTAIYWPLLLWPSALCLSRSPGLLSRRPGGSLCWMLAFLYHILSLTHLISYSIGGPEGPFCWVVAFPTTTSLQLPDFLSPPSYIIVQSPTQSLEWHVCSSSSENNCHAVHRSLSSVYKCTMGFLPCPIFFS